MSCEHVPQAQADDYAYASDRLVENQCNIRNQVDSAIDISRGLRLVSWLLRHGHDVQDAIKALNAIELLTISGERWTVTRLQAAVAESGDVVERVVADGDEVNG